MITRQRLTAFMLVIALSFPAYADPAHDAYKQGAQAERKGDTDAAFEFYKQAYTLVPTNPKYLAAYMHTRFTDASQHIHTGQILRNTGALTEALAQFQRAALVDPSDFLAQQELRRTADMIRSRELQRAAPKVEPKPSKLPEGGEQTVELQPLSNAPITLHMTADTDVAYKTICKLAGINVVIDPDFHPRKLTIDLHDVTLRQALDMVHLQSKTFWRPVLANTIFVTTDSAAKRKESEPNVLKTFYLRNITSPNDLQEAATTLKQVLDVGRVQLIQGQDAMIVRGTPDQMLIAEKLLADIDKPKSEVVIDVLVMQVSRDKMRNLGTNVPTTFTASYVKGLGGVGSTQSATSSSGTATGTVAGSNTGTAGTVTIGSFTVPVASVSFTALASDSNTKILQNPEVRAINDQKATLRIGDKVPIATGSFSPGLSGAGAVSPLVSTQFQYLDVGVNIDITPHIHSDREVTLKMSLEISSVTGTSTIGGITQPVIGQRRIEHETRLADGEVNLLGGILEDSETQSLSGYPLLSQIPFLKYLFAQENKDRNQNEIIFAVTPHIVRSLDVNEENLRTIAIGTGSSIELNRDVSTPTAAAASASQHSGDPAKPTQPPPAPAANVPAAPVSSRPSPTSLPGGK
ncbi:MAG: hypothetical protein WBW33_35335 [Bryobacteraceae bacterium]